MPARIKFLGDVYTYNDQIGEWESETNPRHAKHLSSNAEYRWAVARGLSPSNYYPTLVHRDIAVAVVLFDAEIIERPVIPYEPGVFY